jgi:hypothetical protein
MPYASGQLIRQALIQSKPWQRDLIGAAMVAVGVVLVLIGHVAGVFLAVAEILLLWRMAGDRFRRRSAMSGAAEKGERP